MGGVRLWDVLTGEIGIIVIVGATAGTGMTAITAAVILVQRKKEDAIGRATGMAAEMLHAAGEMKLTVMTIIMIAS